MEQNEQPAEQMATQRNNVLRHEKVIMALDVPCLHASFLSGSNYSFHAPFG
jgi:hypothetical protein